MQYLSPPMSDAGSSPEVGRWTPQKSTSLRRAVTLPDESAFKQSCLPAPIACPQFPCVPNVNACGRSFTSSCVVPSSLSTSSSPESCHEITPKIASPPSLGESDIDTPVSQCSTNWSPRNCGFGGYGSIATRLDTSGKVAESCNTVKINDTAMVLDSAPWFTEPAPYGMHYGQRSMLDSMTRELYGQA